MKRTLSLLLLLALYSGEVSAQMDAASSIDPAWLYKTHCAACHGGNMQGGQAPALRKTHWKYSRSRNGLANVITYGIVNSDMLPWSKVLSADEVVSLVDYILTSQDAQPDKDKPIPSTIQTADYSIKVETLIRDGFNSSPWAIEFVDDRRALITERRGGLRWMVDGRLDPKLIEGIPNTTQYGDSGMLDVALHPDYAKNGWVYICYVHPLGDPKDRQTPAMTRVIRGRVESHRWVDQEDIFRVADALHFPHGSRWGCKFLFDRAGYLYFSIGDIGRNEEVQQLSKPGGKVYRIFPDGSIPPDNPFAGEPDAIQAIFTIGNRHVQGIGQHPVTGAIWATEHGPLGGDEINILQKGYNYGWPIITYGVNYNGEIVSDLTHKAGMEQPIKYWVPSPALGVLEFYTGDLFAKWKNDALVGALAFEEIKRLRLGKDQVISEEVFLKNHGRVRDIETGPDGALYVVLNNPHAVLRLTPQ